MPELPEIEGLRRKLNKWIVGQRIKSIHIQRDSWLNIDREQLDNGVVGRQVLFVERRGKAIIFHLDDGRRLSIQVGGGAELTSLTDMEVEVDTKGAQFILNTEKGSFIIHGARSGSLHWLSARELDDDLKALGSDPLSRHLNSEAFRKRFARRRVTIKSALTNQAIVAGIGSRYAEEIAFVAGLHPSAKTEALTDDQWDTLYHATITVLEDAIDRIEAGEEVNLHVHGKVGEHCTSCQSIIEEVGSGVRAMTFCPKCQSL
ncbi:DNA-formamidopyrimidine glycosylase family protein [Paenibacillus sp. 481]|uniref:DNA-formamidopyrimidine glycosylase family protein n=1 Tax=Paenibacillus sp. 481 TaxID=2835869 RepID=UPI001E53A0C8|nr:DNA-formamidopyrimidine glycosylase family protein [Paenibacillus sp. 481]UHA73096.1 formamidopyrimidine-DNA glycosylase [Paenibacillus sp. 481]